MEVKDKNNIVTALFITIVVVVAFFVGMKFYSPAVPAPVQHKTVVVSDNIRPQIEYVNKTGLGGIAEAGITVANVSETVGYKYVTVNILFKDKQGNMLQIYPIIVGELAPGARKKIAQPIMVGNVDTSKYYKMSIEINDAFR